MPRLVDWTNLGGRPAQSERPMADISTNAYEQGVDTLGRGMRSFGGALSQIAEKGLADEARASTASATAHLLKAHHAFEDGMRENPDGYRTWDKDYAEHMRKAQEEGAALIPNQRFRNIWQSQQKPNLENWRNRVSLSARARARDASLAQTQADIEEIRRLALDPNTPEEDRALHIDAVPGMIENERRLGHIDDTQAGEWSRKWRTGYAVARTEMLPPRERAAVLSATRHATPELGDAIRASAQRLGIDPVDLATVVSYETAGTFDPWKAGPTTQWGQHRGLIQWGEPQRKKYGVYEGMPVADQLKAVEAYLKDAGVRPGMGLLDVYSAVNAGSVGRYNASDAGNGGAPGTVADKVRDQMAGHRRKAAALIGGQAVDPITAMIPPDQRQRMYERATMEAEREDRKEALSVRQLVDDDTASLLATGRGVEGLTFDRVAAALGRDRASIWQQNREVSRQVFEGTRDMPEMTDDQIRVHAERFRPSESDAGEGFNAKAGIYKGVQQRAQELLTQRAEDPAAAVDRSPAVQAARQSLQEDNSVGGREAFIFTRMRQQEILGIPKSLQSPITVAEAKAYAAKMRPLARGQADVADQNAVIEGIVQEIEQTYGSYAPDVLKRVLYQVTLKKDAAEVLSGAITRMQRAESGPLVTAGESRRVEQGEQASSIEQMGGGAPPVPYFQPPPASPYDSPFDTQPAQPAEPKYSMPSLKAVQLLESDPQKYLPFFIQKYGPNAIPRSLRTGPHIDEMYVAPKGKR